jgi:hypothetical protein
MADTTRLHLDLLHFDAVPTPSSTATKVTARLRSVDARRDPPVVELQMEFHVGRLPEDMLVSAYPRWMAQELLDRLGQWLRETA